MCRSPEAGSSPGIVLRKQDRVGKVGRTRSGRTWYIARSWNIILRAGRFKDFKAGIEFDSLEVLPLRYLLLLHTSTESQDVNVLPYLLYFCLYTFILIHVCFWLYSEYIIDI